MIYVNLFKNTHNPDMNKIYVNNKLVHADYCGNNRNKEETENPIDEDNEVIAKIKFIPENKFTQIEVYFYHDKSQFQGRDYSRKVTIDEKEQIIFSGKIFNEDHVEYDVTLFINTSKNNQKYISMKIDDLIVNDNVVDIDNILDKFQSNFEV